MPRKEHHVVPNPNGGWDVKKGSSTKSIKHFDKKDDAVDYGRKVSKNQRSELVIHKKNGTIQRSDSHGKDPNPPRDEDTH